MARIRVIEPEDARGRLREIYEQLEGKRGKIAAIHKIQSLNPESIRSHMDLYMTIMYGKSSLSRAQRELIGVVVSRANGCEYCVRHHLEALRHFWRDHELLERIEEDFGQAGLDDRNAALCDYAWKLSRRPAGMDDDDFRAMRETGWDDRAILDATLTVAYFNFVNRIVTALDVELEPDPGGYKYE